LRDTDHIESAEAAFVEVTGERPTLYRPPWGWLTPWEARRLHARGYTIVGWDVYTLDWQIPEPDHREVADAILADTQPGSIICLHDAYPLEERWEKDVTRLAVLDAVPKLQADGYDFVTVDDLLDVPASRPAAA
ncbi:MAG: polysaccharide deacetylase family protein, partial [Actinomycetota bacterium]